ncbi:MAG: hypothetical protein AB7O52_07995 [Planctomycetota bacterium]
MGRTESPPIALANDASGRKGLLLNVPQDADEVARDPSSSSRPLPTAGTGRRILSWVLLVVTLVVALQVVEHVLTAWVVPPLPAGVDVATVEAFVADVDQRMAARTGLGDPGPLLPELEKVWATFDDHKGCHWFFDSETRDLDVRVSQENRDAHRRLVTYLRENPTRLAPASRTKRTADGAERQDRGDPRIATLSLALAQVYRRVGRQLLGNDEAGEAIEYFEGTLRLLCVAAHRVDLPTLRQVRREHEYSAQFAQEAIASYPENLLREQFLAALASTREVYPGFEVAIDVETLRIWDTLDPRERRPRLFAWQRAQDRRDTVLWLEYLRRWRELCTGPRLAIAEREQRLAELGALLGTTNVYHQQLAEDWERFRRADEGIERSTANIVRSASSPR